MTPLCRSVLSNVGLVWTRTGIPCEPVIVTVTMTAQVATTIAHAVPATAATVITSR